MAALLRSSLVFMHWIITNEFILSDLGLYALGYHKRIYSQRPRHLCIGLSQMNLFLLIDGCVAIPLCFSLAALIPFMHVRGDEGTATDSTAHSLKQ